MPFHLRSQAQPAACKCHFHTLNFLFGKETICKFGEYRLVSLCHTCAGLLVHGCSGNPPWCASGCPFCAQMHHEEERQSVTSWSCGRRKVVCRLCFLHARQLITFPVVMAFVPWGAALTTKHQLLSRSAARSALWHRSPVADLRP